MTDPLYGPDKLCRRTACIEDAWRTSTLKVPPPTGDHLGGVHLDPTDRAHYDGLRTSYGAAPYAVKNATHALMVRSGAFVGRPDDHDTDLRRDTEIALQACFDEIDRLRQQVAHVQVDKDHAVRAASARALDCEAHGDVIRQTEAQVTHFEQARDRVEKARLVLLAEHHTITELLGAATDGTLKADLTVTDLIDALRKIHVKTSAAHRRAFNR